MSGAYFTIDDHLALTSLPNHNVQTLTDKFSELHRLFFRRMRDHNWDLHPHWDKAAIITTHSAASSGEINGLALPYLRSKEQRQLVERLMGRDGQVTSSALDIHRHPVIELRITPTHLAIELIMSPLSWWDQRNLIGKLSIDRHRQALRSAFAEIDGDFRFGFWEGTELSDMHLTSRQVLRGNVLDEWIGTFSDGQDWLRVGVWYEPGHPSLATDTILSEVVRRFSALYRLYTFMMWTSNNNFQSFYRSGPAFSGRGKDLGTF
ncbi:MAG: hypothetical protein IAE80_08135 [Anaerolinea sp.]|nr:hypothetical protein [Anaerolinea sp.]